MEFNYETEFTCLQIKECVFRMQGKFPHSQYRDLVYLLRIAINFGLRLRRQLNILGSINSLGNGSYLFHDRKLQKHEWQQNHWP